MAPSGSRPGNSKAKSREAPEWLPGCLAGCLPPVPTLLAGRPESREGPEFSGLPCETLLRPPQLAPRRLSSPLRCSGGEVRA